MLTEAKPMTLNARTLAKYEAADAQRARSCYRVQRMATESRGRLLRLEKHWKQYQCGEMTAQQFIYYYGR